MWPINRICVAVGLRLLMPPMVATFIGLEPAALAQAEMPTNGLVLTCQSADGKHSDVTVAERVALYVEGGAAPAPFVPPGPFTATWEGSLNAELRTDYFFQVESRGRFKLEVNNTAVLESPGGISPLSGAVRLNKGSNAFRATLISPPSGNAFVRLAWTERGTNPAPIPPEAFTHLPTAALRRGQRLHLGRELFLELRCIRCHTDAGATAGVPELAQDAPAFAGLGARRHFDWMARWILDPKALRPNARMPRLLQGPHAAEDAQAIAAFLASLREGGEVPLPRTELQTRQNTLSEGENPTASTEPKPLYERLRCGACHNPPNATEPDPKKLSQKHVAEKFPRGKLAEFLRAPEAHYAWTPMPNFHLTANEAGELEDWLFAAAGSPELKGAPTDPATIERGRKLVQTKGCLNCHDLQLENTSRAPALSALAGRPGTDLGKALAGDCLGDTPRADFGFTPEQRVALRDFVAAGLASLRRHVPTEFAQRQVRMLQCAACHGEIDFVPPLPILGGKLRPEWMARLFAGEIRHKLRFDTHPKGEPWVEARMPAFVSRARPLADGLAAQHGLPPRTPPAPAPDPELARIGHKLVGKEGGFSCVSCHAVGSMLALEVFESEGLNLAWAAERLQPSYFTRWMRSPLSIDPQTKMPTYFDEGQSPLTDVLNGDAERQIQAIWHYLLLGERMPRPSVTE
ncbi:MAG TPA: c-type cytochrome [Methylomirabilota bacterium]|nr:c-type cytochrome [Methylomirabilota bacterium]